MFGRLLVTALLTLTPAHHYRVERAEPVPILMYHVVAAPPPGAPFPGLYVTRQQFDAQVRWLARHGYRAVTLRQVWGLRPGLVRALVHAGWEVDAHTVTHPDLTTLDPRRLWYEVAGSRRLLQREFHVPVDFFAYPAGRYDAAVVRAVRRAGYLGATTTDEGVATPSEGLYTLDRLRVDGASSLAALLRTPP